MSISANQVRILLAGPTLLYIPVYLAWLHSNESIRERVRFWTPPVTLEPSESIWRTIFNIRGRTDQVDAELKGKPDQELNPIVPDPLMAEFFNEHRNSDILMCVGDPLRAFHYKRELWGKDSLCATLINELPLRAYTLFEGRDDHDPIYLCHRRPMSTFEIAQYLSPNENDIIDDVAPGFENVYVDVLLDRLDRMRESRGVRKVVLIGPNTLIQSAFSKYLAPDRDIEEKIQGLHRGRSTGKSFLLTGILKGRSVNGGLRDDFIERIEVECSKINDDPERCGTELYRNVRSLNRFHNLNLRELVEVVERLRKIYKVARPDEPTDRIFNGLGAAGRVRYNLRCKHGIRSDCKSCGLVYEAREPFRRRTL